MGGETNLARLLHTLNPVLHSGEYVFCVAPALEGIAQNDIVMVFREEEGYTIILRKELADQLQLHYTFTAAWITLTVHSALEAVGLTAAFSTALAGAGISCNVIAAYYHDHIFVAHHDAARAMDVLKQLSE